MGEVKKKNGHAEEITSPSMNYNFGEIVDSCIDNIALQEELILEAKEFLSATKISKMSERANPTESEKNEEKEIALKIQLAAMDCKTMLQQVEQPLVLDEFHVFEELKDVKQQKHSLIVQMLSAMEDKIEAEKQTEPSSVKARFFESYIEELKTEIEEAKIEQVVIDMNRLNIEAEIRELEARRESEAEKYTKSMKETMIKIDDLHKELSLTKDIKQKLAVTVSDLNVLQNEMELIRAMDKSSSEANLRNVAKKHEMPDSNSLLQSSKSELEAANKLLWNLKGESFQLMNEIDIRRKELMHISEEKNNSSKIRKISDSKLASLNMKLHKVLTQVDSASRSEKRAQSIVSNLYEAIEQLKYDIDAAKRETNLIVEETKAIKEETQRIGLHTASVQEKFEAALKELEVAKALEASELKKLSLLTETTMSDRAILSLFSPTVTISKFEYLYLTQQGKAAQEVADLKVAAAKVWLKAFEAENKERDLEMQMKWPVIPYEEKKLSGPTKGLVPMKQRNNLLIGYKSVPRKQKSIQLIDYKDDKEYIESSKIKLAIAMPRRSITVTDLSGEPGRAGTTRSSVSARRRPSFSSSPKPPSSPTMVKQVMGNIIMQLKNRRHRNKF